MANATPPRCPDCDTFMTEGFLLDVTHGGRHPVQWVEGPHEKSIWTGAKIGNRPVYVTESYRCDECGLLRTYALKRKK
ncbi:MAG: PF20097 family protein [Bacteroidota bacterium]